MTKYNFSKFFKKNQLFILLMTVVLVLGTIAAIVLSGKPTEKNTRAAGDSVGIILTPSSQTVQPDQQFTVTIQADAGSLALTGYDMTFQVDNDTASIVSFAPSNTFNSSLINSIKSPTVIRIAAVDTSSNQITGVVTLGTLTLQAKSSGTGSISLASSQVTASGHDAAIPTSCSPASFAIATPPTATSAPTNVPEAPTNTPTPTPTPSPTPIVESNNNHPDDNNDNNQGNNSNSNSDNGSSNSDNHAFDFNGDGHINLPDLVVLIRNFHKSGQGDLNADGKVDITDFSILLRHWTN